MSSKKTRPEHKYLLLKTPYNHIKVNNNTPFAAGLHQIIQTFILKFL